MFVGEKTREIERTRVHCSKHGIVIWCIDFSINGQCTEHRPLFERTPTPCKIKVNWLICDANRVKSNNFNAAILNFLRNSTIHFSMFLYLVTCFLRVTVLLLCRLQAVSKIHVLFYPYLINDIRQNCSTLWPAQQNRDSQETCYRI